MTNYRQIIQKYIIVSPLKYTLLHITVAIEKERNKDAYKLRLNWWINGIHLCLDILIVIFFTTNCVIELTITVLWLKTSKRVVKWFGGHTISTGTGYRTVASRVLIDNRRNLRRACWSYKLRFHIVTTCNRSIFS